MLKNIKDIFNTAASFLQSGVAPPNSAPDQVKQLEDTNHLNSKKFFAAFSGFLILGVFFAVGVAVLLYLLKTPEAISQYVIMFTKTMEVFATIMAVYIGGQAVVDLKYNSSSNVSLEEKKETINITKRVIGTEKEHDYTLDPDED
jgi:hypothetical protein